MDLHPHLPVLLEESLTGLSLHPGSHIIDCTAGYGGHSAEILKQIGPTGSLLCLDRDPQAIAALTKRFAAEQATGQVHLFQGPFSRIQEAIQQEGLPTQYDGILADLGVSSPQIDDPARGFSFQRSGPLDMRMEGISSQSLSAQEFLQEVSETELREILWKYGEEPQGRKIARAIVAYRDQHPLTTTEQLSTLITQTVHYPKKSRKHPATKVFQALRLYLNQELQEVETWLPQAFSLLKGGGRLAVITFHSLEDRIVKHFCKGLAQPHTLVARDIPVFLEPPPKVATLIRPFPTMPTPEECERNPRARSAKLRVIEKLPSTS